jgi:MFS family permease
MTMEAGWMLARLVIFWFTPFVSALIDFTDTMLVCAIVIGIGVGVAVATATSTAPTRSTSRNATASLIGSLAIFAAMGRASSPSVISPPIDDRNYLCA